MSSTSSDSITESFFALHHGLPRQSPGSDATTRRLLELAGPLPERPRVLDIGCGPGRAALLLAAEAGADVTAVDLHQPFLDELTAAAAARGLTDRVHAVNASMDRLPFDDGSFDAVWAEGSAYIIGFDTALRTWRRLLAPGGVMVVTEIEWATATPAPQARAFWEGAYPLRDADANRAAAERLGYRVVAHVPQPDEDWWDEYYVPLAERAAAADPARPGMAEALAMTHAEIDLRREHGADYRYAGYVLRPADRRNGAAMPATWTVHAERPEDVAAIREINLAAFPTALEADLVEALRADPDAWIDGLSMVATTADGTPAGYALITRCHVGDQPALCLAPCAVRPEYQRSGAGSAAVRAALDAARAMGENLVVVLGHPDYYPRFGFVRASTMGIRSPFEVPDEAQMALSLDPSRPVPGGVISYPAAFGS